MQGKFSSPPIHELPEDLRQPAALFVTLRQPDGELRGCVGTVDAVQPLALEALRTAAAAATEDFRFAPLQPEEIEPLKIEISILGPLQRIAGPDQIAPRQHGVMIRQGSRRGLFLPQVWEETGWDRDRFVRELCLSKAGIDPRTLQSPGVEWFVFEIESIS